MQAAAAGLGTSMMERLQAAGLPVQLLRTQYRMHPELAAWPSATFYGNQLISHPTPADRQPPQAGRGDAQHRLICASGAVLILHQGPAVMLSAQEHLQLLAGLPA